MKLSPLRLSFPFPFWHSLVLPPASTHPRHPPGPDGYGCSALVRTMEKITIYMRGWLNYYGIADMKKNIESLNGWLYRRIRMCIWKQWKLPRTRMRKLTGLGVDSHYAATIAYDRKGYWFNAGNKAVNWALSKERLINRGFYDIAAAYQSLHVNY